MRPSFSVAETYAVEGGISAGAKTFTLASDPTFENGTYLDISMDNDPDLMYTNPAWKASWAERARGQVINAVSVDGRQVTADVPVRLEYDAVWNPEIKRIVPIENAGVEDLFIYRQDDEHNHIIFIQYAVNCWVRNCELYKCMFTHVHATTSRFLTVKNCYMREAHDYGGGGQGYGVQFVGHTCDCLVTNNIFKHLRHSMIIATGVSGNVFSYNYSREGTLCDIAVHGHYTYMNLFEGNDVIIAYVADWWGPTGPHTTLFRNRIRESNKYSSMAAITVADSSHDENIIGNSLLTAGITVEDTCLNTWLEKNVLFSPDNSTITKAPDTVDVDNYIGEPSPAPQWNMPASLYLSSPPDFWGLKPWPAIGSDADMGRSGDFIKLPAQERYENP